MGLIALLTHIWKDLTSPSDRRLRAVDLDRRIRESAIDERGRRKNDLHYGIVKPGRSTRRRMRGGNRLPEVPPAESKPRPVSAATKHRFEATCYYVKAKSAGSDADRRMYARQGLDACRRACEEMRREGRRPYAATYDVAELALLADDPGAAYAAASEVVAAPGIPEKLRASAAILMELAFVRLHLPLPKAAYA